MDLGNIGAISFKLNDTNATKLIAAIIKDIMNSKIKIK